MLLYELETMYDKNLIAYLILITIGEENWIF